MSATLILSIIAGIAINFIGVAIIFWKNSSNFDAKIGERISHIQEDIKDIEEDIKLSKETYVPRVELNIQFKNIYKRLELADNKK